jgi:hypothetical protein
MLTLPIHDEPSRIAQGDAKIDHWMIMPSTTSPSNRRYDGELSSRVIGAVGASRPGASRSERNASNSADGKARLTRKP